MAEDREPTVGREDAEAALAARAELGSAYEPALVEGFVERIEAEVERRVAQRAQVHRAVHDDTAGREKRQFALGIVSLATGIPITAIAGGIAEVPGVAMAWLGIAAVNIAHAVSGRR